jgi:hypothetical protein
VVESSVLYFVCLTITVSNLFRLLFYPLGHDYCSLPSEIEVGVVSNSPIDCNGSVVC